LRCNQNFAGTRPAFQPVRDTCSDQKEKITPIANACVATASSIVVAVSNIFIVRLPTRGLFPGRTSSCAVHHK
jgi:hypothetical protein